jgi:hypothetical protein
LDRLCAALRLSAFERDTLLLCAGVELDAGFAAACAAAQGHARHGHASFSLALAALPGAHWSAITPAGPLRHWRLVEVAPGDALTASALHIDERVLHHLVGLDHLDERLAGLVTQPEAHATLPPSQRALAQRLAATWTNERREGPPQLLQLEGDDAPGKRDVAQAVCERLGLRLHVMAADALPTNAGDVEHTARLWQREALLSASALLVDAEDLDATESARERAVERFVEAVRSPLFLTVRERRSVRRDAVTVALRRPEGEEARLLWTEALGEDAVGLNGAMDGLVAQFTLGSHAIRTACIQARSLFPAAPPSASELVAALWDEARGQVRPRLESLAQRIPQGPSWEDLVLPDAEREVLRSIAVHVRHRAKVYEEWGFAAKQPRGLGISALFAGPSGTGKTLAAEVLARELRLDLYRIDLSQVVSKYIGETEKNLRRVFDAAEEGGAVLLFDEADALFGKRSEVKDSHDRYANIEVSYLLQRMEQYRGLAILTTNMKEALDTAFLRRIRFVVNFPFPGLEQRAEIWRRMFPAGVPVEGLDVEKLARLNVAGGTIRNIALGAAFLAADADQPLRMTHLLRAARAEFGKLEKPLAEMEVKGWT